MERPVQGPRGIDFVVVMLIMGGESCPGIVVKPGTGWMLLDSAGRTFPFVLSAALRSHVHFMSCASVLAVARVGVS